MVQRVVKLFQGAVSGLHEAAYVLAAFVILSQIVALVRDRLLAHYFGAGIELDLYYAAFRIPDFVFVSVASIVSLFVLIPILTEKIEKNKKKAQEFLSSITTAFFIFIVVVSAALFFAVPFLSAKLYPGFTDAGTQETLVMLTRILLLSPILLGLSNIAASVTQVSRRFVVYALSPVVYNLGIVIGILFLRPAFGVAGVAYGVIIGALLHLVVQLPAMVREGLLPIPTFVINMREVMSVVGVSLPRTAALAVSQLALLALVAIASVMPEGSISVFNFAFNLQGAPLAIIGVSYSVAAFPALARLFSNGEKDAFLRQMIVAVRHVVFWSFPAMALFIVLRAHIVRTVLGSGAFDWADTRLTAAILALFVISLIAQSLVLLFVRGYYASGRTQKPLIINVLAAVAIVALALLGLALFEAFPVFRYFFESLFRVSDVPGTSVLVLPLAFSLGFVGNALAFWLLFRRDFGGHLPHSLYRTLWESFSASVITGAAAYVGLQLLQNVFDINTLLGVFLQGFLAGIIGIVAGAAVLILLNNKEGKEIWRTLHHKFWQSRVPAPDIDEVI